MSNNVREIRERKGISIREMEILTKIPRGRLSNIERGLEPLYPKSKKTLEDVLGEEIMVSAK